MAKQTDARAQRERKQKIFLAVGGLIFVILAAIQGPKLLDQLSGSEAAPVTPTTQSTPTVPTTTTGVPPTTPTSTPVGGKGSAVLAGVPVSSGSSPEAEEGQLWSFSRFEAKDPFEQNVSTETAAGSESNASSTSKAAPQKVPSNAPGTLVTGTAVAGSPGPESAPEAAVTNATIAVNGKPEQLTVKDVFPKVDKAFVLVGLKDGVAKIGVAGGSFTDGSTVSVRLGKQVTLVDTATGARFVLKLLYVGSAPEQIEKFSARSKDG